MEFELRDLFLKGSYFPLDGHTERIDKYRRNEKLAQGDHANVFGEGSKSDLYISANFAGLITRKSADFLVGEAPSVTSGKKDGAKESEALQAYWTDNKMHRTVYQTALQTAIKGDGFLKVRYGQEYAGAFPETFDPKRVIIESIDPKKVYPQTSPLDASKVIAYHIAEPIEVGYDKYQLYVESHFAGRVVYRRFELNVFMTQRDGEITMFKIGDEIVSFFEVQNTGVPIPLVVHFANYNDGTKWQGDDDITEHMALFDEINNRMTQIATILDKHADPALAVPTGLLREEEGKPQFNVAMNKVFEVMGKDDVMPTYITNSNPQVDQAMKELEKMVEYLLATSEIPAMVVGMNDSGTSGNSGLAIKWRMNSLLAKINRKRQFFEDSLKRVLMLAQMVELSANPAAAFEIVEPVINFNDGLPTDDTELANRMNIRTNGSQTMSQKTAIMLLDGLTEEQADEEIKRIEEEKKAAMIADPSIFNEEDPKLPDDGEDPEEEKDPKEKETSKEVSADEKEK